MNPRFHYITGCALFLISVITPISGFAAVSDPPTFFSSSLKMIWGLLIVLGIILIIYGIARKRLTLLQGGGKGIIKVIETRHLLPKKTLFLVEVRGKEYLIGSGGESLNLITAVGEETDNQTTFKAVLDHSKANRSA